MSTKAIREALGALLSESARANDFAGRGLFPDESERALYRDALSEVEAIERAAKVLHREDIASMVYDVRERAAWDEAFSGNTWEHPRVEAYGAAAQVIYNIAKESNE